MGSPKPVWAMQYLGGGNGKQSDMIQGMGDQVQFFGLRAPHQCHYYHSTFMRKHYILLGIIQQLGEWETKGLDIREDRSDDRSRAPRQHRGTSLRGCQLH